MARKPKTPPERASAALLFVFILLLAVFTLRSFLVSAPSVDPDHPFNTVQAFERLERILGDETPHPVDTDVNDAVRERLLTEITDLGFEPIVRDDFHCVTGYGGVRCARVQNVMFWIGEPGPDAVMIASHYDSVPAGPGAADDGSGMAASLEIARIYKDRDLPRPILVLITDGEEIGLVGAASFVENDPFAELVSAVVSMEARGVRGPVAMFETSVPNGRDIVGLDPNSLPFTRVKNPISSSFAVDIYRSMPNGTDVTRYLTLGMDAANYAIGQGAHFYHTPRDNLAMLDKRSFFHMGANALEAVEGFVYQDPDAPDDNKIYIDLFGYFMLAIPEGWSLPIILLSGLAAGFVFWSYRGAQTIRTALFPPIAIMLGLICAVLATFVIGQLRPEAHFGAANPWALRGLQNAAALTGAALALAVIIRPGVKTQTLMSAWMWMALIALVVTLKFPGAAILFVPTLAIIILAIAVAAIGQSSLSRGFSILAALILGLIALPTTAIAESMLFVENAAPLTVFLVFLFIGLAPLAMNSFDLKGWRRWRGVILGLIASAGFGYFAYSFPAYSTDAPRSLSVQHVMKTGSENAYWSSSGSDPLPDAMTAITPFIRGTAPGQDGDRWIAEAPLVETPPIEFRLLEYPSLLGEPVLSADVIAPEVDRVVGYWTGETDRISAIQIGDQIISIDDAKEAYFVCYGRSCQAIGAAITVPERNDGYTLNLKAYYYGLDENGEALLNARPDWTLPQHTGDYRMVTTSVDLPPNCMLAAFVNDARCLPEEEESDSEETDESGFQN